MKTIKDHKSLPRGEQIKEEKRRAAEFSMSPQTPISIAKNFRVEGLARVASAPPHGLVKASSISKVLALSPRKKNPIGRLANPEVLSSSVDDLLERLTPANRALAIPLLLDLYGDLVAQMDDSSEFASLHKRVMTAAFGEHHFDQMQGGSAKEHCDKL